MGKAYIYMLRNKVNDKVYIGKTTRNIKERYEEHILAMHRTDTTDRKLYKALRKYGPENFELSLVETCTTENVGEREKYWIAYYDSYKHGYNMTLGGDGKSYIEEEPVIKLYEELENVTEVAKKLKIDRETVSNILKSNNIVIKSNGDVMKAKFGIQVMQFDKDGRYIATYNSAMEAATAIGKASGKSNGAASHITDACKGKRNKAYGFKWKFAA